MRELRFAPEYGCYPLWLVKAQGGLENIEAYALPIPKELSDAIEDWGDRFEQTLNKEYPPDSGFISELEASEFREEGEMLAHQLQEIIADKFVVKVRLNAVSVRR